MTLVVWLVSPGKKAAEQVDKASVPLIPVSARVQVEPRLWES